MDQHKQLASTIDTLAKANGWSVEAILADPRQIDLIDHRAREFLEQNRSKLEHGLLRKARACGAKERLRIGTVLLEMGAPSGSPLVLDASQIPTPRSFGPRCRSAVPPVGTWAKVCLFRLISQRRRRLSSRTCRHPIRP